MKNKKVFLNYTCNNNNRYFPAYIMQIDNKIIIFLFPFAFCFREKNSVEKDWKSSKHRREERAQPEQRAVNKSLYYSRMYDIFYFTSINCIKFSYFIAAHCGPVQRNNSPLHAWQFYHQLAVPFAWVRSTKYSIPFFLSTFVFKTTNTQFVDNKPTSTVASSYT